MTRLDEVALVEASSAALSIAGLTFLAAALLIRCFYVRWLRADAIVVLAEGRPRLRWFTRQDVHEVAWGDPQVPAPAPGTSVTVYFHARWPDRWSLTAPHRRAWPLLGVGLVLNGAASLLPVVLA